MEGFHCIQRGWWRGSTVYRGDGGGVSLYTEVMVEGFHYIQRGWWRDSTVYRGDGGGVSL